MKPPPVIKGAAHMGQAVVGRLTSIRKKPKKVGLPPGSVVFTGTQRVEEARVTVIDYDEERVEERTLEPGDALAPPREGKAVMWVNVDGLHDTALIERVGEAFGIHPLVLEDVADTNQRVKAEDYEDQMFVLLKMLDFDQATGSVTAEQVSIVFGPRFVVSFQERPGDVFEYVRERIRKRKGRIRKLGPDFLAYALMDAVVDHYFVILEHLDMTIEELEEALIADPAVEKLRSIQSLKGDLIFLRKNLWPMREMVTRLERGDTTKFKKDTRVYLRDLSDHTMQVLETVETFRDMLSSLMDIYLSSVSNRMNEVMKVLTIIATIFIPLTFIVGVYGMNFDNMPELGWRWSYFIVWGLMIAVALMMFGMFRRAKWL